MPEMPEALCVRPEGTAAVVHQTSPVETDEIQSLTGTRTATLFFGGVTVAG